MKNGMGWIFAAVGSLLVLVFVILPILAQNEAANIAAAQEQIAPNEVVVTEVAPIVLAPSTIKGVFTQWGATANEWAARTGPACIEAVKYEGDGVDKKLDANIRKMAMGCILFNGSVMSIKLQTTPLILKPTINDFLGGLSADLGKFCMGYMQIENRTPMREAVCKMGLSMWAALQIRKGNVAIYPAVTPPAIPVGNKQVR